MARQAVLIIARELIGDKKLSLTARLLLGFLLDHRNKKTGQCNPRRKILACELGVSIPTIQRALRELRKAELIQSKRGQHTNFYAIQMDQIDLSENPSDGSKRSLSMDQIDPSGPPTPLYEPYQGNLERPRAEARFRPSPILQATSNAREMAPVPKKAAARELISIDGGGPIDLYYSAVLGSLRDRGRLLNAHESRQVGNLMMLRQIERLKKEGKVS